MTSFLLRISIAAHATLFATMVSVAPAALADSPAISAARCGPIKTGYGPFDYRTVASDVRHRVEDFHFTPTVEQGIDGATGTYGGDVDYTLRAFPNNPRALLSISKYSVKHRTENVPGAHYVTECYFERAVRFQPDDPMAQLMYAIYLRDRKRMGEVRPHLDEAERLRGEQSNFDFDYNLGLLWFDVGDYDRAMTAARRAYALGAPLPALEKKLKTAGKWRDDPAPAPAQAPAPAAAAEGVRNADPSANADPKTVGDAPPAATR